MKIKLNQNQFDYLNANLFKYQTSLMSKFEIKKEHGSFIINIDDTEANEIRDWASEELQKRGFDINYRLNAEGKILNGFVDAFYSK